MMSEMANATQPSLFWLWRGYLAPGKVTALISLPKIGQNDSRVALVARFAQGGPLAGLAVRRTGLHCYHEANTLATSKVTS